MKPSMFGPARAAKYGTFRLENNENKMEFLDETSN